MAAKALYEFSNCNESCSAQVILGDFNSPPESIPYNLLSRGYHDDVSSTSSFLDNESEQSIDVSLCSTFIYLFTVAARELHSCDSCPNYLPILRRCAWMDPLAHGSTH